ncbi:hydrolase 1, exosortase A system-associated [Roseateles amylovorans]|uniref:Hydrolase 1, exosortase A system-associated n=1 Tax=Roseateles amylovorans TaxID=2978473 RepID=A0ABY6B4N0_9BURK|nr:hydrolase 1, exosortase A system-associated [Roseateles amylovorans]UXH80154.1 hydrolase 1, exosortase A system-associated [Roseateles amylovorans]
MSANAAHTTRPHPEASEHAPSNAQTIAQTDAHAAAPSGSRAAPRFAARHRDTLLQIDCHGHALPGILSEPLTEDAGDLGVLLIVGGPQYRVGAHRQFTLLGRALAADGVPCLRFDYRGMGDAEGDQKDFAQVDDDIAATLDAWQRERPALRRVVLWGLCDAASAALLYVHRRRDPRIAGLSLINPWVRTEASLARTQVKHYYLDRLRQGAFWRKLLSGRVGFAAVRELVGKLIQTRRSASTSSGQPGAPDDRHYTEQMADGLRHFGRPVLLMLSGDDYVAKEFLDRCRDGGAAWRGLLSLPTLRREDLPEADHTCSSAAWRAQVEDWTVSWLRALAATGHPGGPALPDTSGASTAPAPRGDATRPSASAAGAD